MRRAIADYVNLERGARATPERVLVLTSSQSLLGVGVLLNGRLEAWEAVVLLLLFLVQLPFPQANVRYGLSLLYVLLAILLFIRYARYVPQHLRLTFRKEADSKE